MFREKFTNFHNKRGYLYIRESVYVRDRRTLKRKPSKLCDGSATKQRGRYSKKIDIYCGRIYEVEPVSVDTFSNYIQDVLGEDYLNLKLKAKFSELIDLFVRYLLYIYDIDEDDFYNGKKKVYTIADGYLSREGISWLKRFEIRGDYDNPREIQRFNYRCEDVGVYDEDIINTLYLKLVPQLDQRDILEDYKIIGKGYSMERHKDFRSFIKKG